MNRERKPERHVPLVRPAAIRLSRFADRLEAIEDSKILSNYGPVNAEFEQALLREVFGQGACLTVCNATIGLMLAIREVIGDEPPQRRRFALMPSFTFAAAAQAAMWCGLTPLLCDIDPHTWLPDADREEELLRQYRGQIAVVVPYATFGNCLDLDRYTRLAERYKVPVVVDAAASLGSQEVDGHAFGSGFRWPVVFSMHATKAFSVAEGGVIYCADEARIARLRTMGCFGFEQPRVMTQFGLNAKLSEVAGLAALLQLEEFPKTMQDRDRLVQAYSAALDGQFGLQRMTGARQSASFQSILLPRELAGTREVVLDALRAMGVGAATYFSPHLAEQPYLRSRVKAGPLPVTEDIAGRVISLPLLTGMTAEELRHVLAALREVTATLAVAA